MHRIGNINLALAIALLSVAGICFLSTGPGSGVLDSEIDFDTGFMNSVLVLSDAKSQWGDEKHVAKQEIPTMEDLAPYLGKWTNSIKRFVALGIEYKISPIVEEGPQADTATITRNLYFQHGYSHFYPAGTRYSTSSHWTFPKYATGNKTLIFYYNINPLLETALVVLSLYNLFLFFKRKHCSKLAGADSKA